MINKITPGILFVIIVSLAIYVVDLRHRMNKQVAEITRLKSELSDCGQMLNDADAAIERQNMAVEAARVDTVIVEKQVAGIAKKYTETREVIVEKIKKDSSSENKLFIIDSVLRCYHGM